MFESVLTRTIGAKTNELSLDIMVVRTYFFDILEDIMLNGFILGDEKYVFLQQVQDRYAQKNLYLSKRVF